MSKTTGVDAIDAIVEGLAALEDGPKFARLQARARAGLIEKALNEFGFVITANSDTMLFALRETEKVFSALERGVMPRMGYKRILGIVHQALASAALKSRSAQGEQG